ncbi:unnamed protein product [Clavelina lepadiformis]|uniref:Uncharacterized protein n=1 Tax=Clavelina lepadiformis TaxID=159417 RepID=A0ABP0FEE2_CLALP
MVGHILNVPSKNHIPQSASFRSNAMDPTTMILFSPSLSPVSTKIKSSPLLVFFRNSGITNSFKFSGSFGRWFRRDRCATYRSADSLGKNSAASTSTFCRCCCTIVIGRRLDVAASFRIFSIICSTWSLRSSASWTWDFPTSTYPFVSL